MAVIVRGIGMSHSPMMATEGKYWLDFADGDYNHPMLYDESGKHVTYEELNQQRNNFFADEAQPEKMLELFEQMEQGYAHLKDEVAKADPDIVLVISNDHPGEFLEFNNVPAFAVFYGDQIISSNDERREMSAKDRFKKLASNNEAYQQMVTGMGMEKNNVWPGSSKVGGQLIESLIEQGIDVGILKAAADPSKHGHGHGYGMVVRKLMNEDRLIPMIPLYLNSWYPNVPTPSRCYDIGRAIRRAVESMADHLKVCIIASGGLSHFVTNVKLDEQVLNFLRNRNEYELRNLPRHLLKAGNAEILNWVMLSGAVEHLEFNWSKYVPVFRTPAGSGIGMSFATWS